jgi:hypothetical protein
MKLEKQNNAGAWTIQIDSKNFRVIKRDQYKVVAEITTFSGRGEPQNFHLHLTWNELELITSIADVKTEAMRTS